MELKMTQLRMHVNKARSQQVIWSETVKDFLANEFVNLRKRYKCLVNFNTLQSLILISESLCKLCPRKSEADDVLACSTNSVNSDHCKLAIAFVVTNNRHINGLHQKHLISERYKKLKKSFKKPKHCNF